MEDDDKENIEYRIPLAALQERVNGIQRELENISAAVRELTRIVTVASKPQYHTLGLFGTLFCTITAGAWWVAVTLTVAPLDKRISYLETTTVRQDVYMEKRTADEKERLRMQDEIGHKADDAETKRVTGDIIQRLQARPAR
ncbi:MAG: hypothetical protein C5B60_10270 [Chloroflexi bacterium]|nr:MAG: hypothetical protein C5B60_10270 [Chloroflexota bacterium]